MLEKGLLYKVVNGFYTTKRDEILACNAFQPFYYSLQTAMSLRDIPFWTQEAHASICTTRRVRKSTVSVYGKGSGYKVFAHHLPQRYFFGYGVVSDPTYGKMLVATPEKVLIDMVYLGIKESGQAYAALSRAISPRRLARYLAAYDARTKKSVLGVYRSHRDEVPAGMRH